MAALVKMLAAGAVPRDAAAVLRVPTRRTTTPGFGPPGGHHISAPLMPANRFQTDRSPAIRFPNNPYSQKPSPDPDAAASDAPLPGLPLAICPVTAQAEWSRAWEAGASLAPSQGGMGTGSANPAASKRGARRPSWVRRRPSRLSDTTRPPGQPIATSGCLAARAPPPAEAAPPRARVRIIYRCSGRAVLKLFLVVLGCEKFVSHSAMFCCESVHRVCSICPLGRLMDLLT